VVRDPDNQGFPAFTGYTAFMLANLLPGEDADGSERRRRRLPNLTAKVTATVQTVWVPITSSTSCDQPIFVDHATDASLFSDAVQVEVDRLG
jgi:hypothetical protein